MSKDKLNVAVIGAGMFGKFHGQFMCENPRANVLWICDANLQAAESLANECNAKAADDYRKVLNDGCAGVKQGRNCYALSLRQN